jgi:hypothetical protein
MLETPQQKLVAELCGIELIDVAVNQGGVHLLLKMIPHRIQSASGAVNLRTQFLIFRGQHSGLSPFYEKACLQIFHLLTMIK